METISFNTGRRYTAEGQFIVATLHDDKVVTFFDHSRGVQVRAPLSIQRDRSDALVR
jgi:hypothetical protein